MFELLCLFLSLQLLAHLTKFANVFWAANLHRRVPVWVKGWYVKRRGAQLIPAMRWLTWPLNTTEFRLAHKTRGSSVSACKVMCEEMHPNPRHAHWYERVHWGTAYKGSLELESRQPPVPVGTPPDPATTSVCILLLSCSSLLFSGVLCFLLLYGAASSSSDPQEAIHFLIICTSNRGRNRDADHKFSPPPLRCGVIAQQQLPLIGAVGSNC